VARGDVGDLVGEDGGQRIIVGCHLVKSPGDENVAGRRGKRIDRIAGEHTEAPGEPRAVGKSRQRPADEIDAPHDLLVAHEPAIGAGDFHGDRSADHPLFLRTDAGDPFGHLADILGRIDDLAEIEPAELPAQTGGGRQDQEQAEKTKGVHWNSPFFWACRKACTWSFLMASLVCSIHSTSLRAWARPRRPA
jgi:hypothetical protein